MANQNITENKTFQESLADVQALRQVAEQAALQLLATRNEATLKETVNQLMEASGDSDATSDGSNFGGSSSEPSTGSATDSTSTDATSTDDDDSTDDSKDADDSTDGKTIEVDADELASKIGDAVKKAVQQVAGGDSAGAGSGDGAGDDSEDQIDSDDLTDDNSDSSEGGYDDSDFDDDDDIVVVPDGSGDDSGDDSHGSDDESDDDSHEDMYGDAPTEEGSSSKGEDGNVFIIQDKDGEDGEHGASSDYDASPQQNENNGDDDESGEEYEHKHGMHESASYAKLLAKHNELKSNFKQLISEVSDIRLFQQKVKYFEAIVKEHLEPFNSSNSTKIKESIKTAKNAIINKFDNAHTLEEAAVIYASLNNDAVKFAKELLKESSIVDNKETKNSKVIAEGAVRGRKNFKLESAKRIISESKSSEVNKTEILRGGLLNEAIKARIPSEEEMNTEFKDWKRFL